MALTQTSRGRSDQFQMQTVSNRFKESGASPERTRVWTESNSKLNLHIAGGRRCVVVPVIYSLSRNGQLEHPHFMEVALSSSQGLFLRDVMNRLNFLRGKGMSNHYSWSAKRGYKNGYVWHDLDENDFIHPVHGQEYILKGSEILEASTSLISNSSETPSSSSSGKQVETTANADVVEPEFPLRSRRRNQSWSSTNLHEYKVYKASFSGELGGKAASDASTQTDEKRHRRRQAIKECEIVEEEEEPVNSSQEEEQQTTELSRSEISPPPSDSSPETLKSFMKSFGNLASSSSSSNQIALWDAKRSAVDPQLPGAGKMKPASILASLISCGSISFRDCGAGASEDHGFSLISHYRAKLPRGGNRAVEEAESVSSDPTSGSFAKMAMEDKEYFSGSLVETRKDEFPSLKRSSSYNSDRRSQLRLAGKEIEGVRAKCIPRKQRVAYPPPPLKELSDAIAIKGSDV